jgi:hypothetical protein
MKIAIKKVPLLKTHNHAAHSEKCSLEMRKFCVLLLSRELLKEKDFLATWFKAKQLKQGVRWVAPTEINICLSFLGFTFHNHRLLLYYI